MNTAYNISESKVDIASMSRQSSQRAQPAAALQRRVQSREVAQSSAHQPLVDGPQRLRLAHSEAAVAFALAG